MLNNKENRLFLRRGDYLLIINAHRINDEKGVTVAIPTFKNSCNAKVLDVKDDGSFTAHWKENYNLRGDFSTELMRFDCFMMLDEDDLKARNEFRKAHGLLEI